MGTMAKRILTLFVMGLFFAACGGGKAVKKTEPVEDARKEMPSAKMNEDFDPLTLQEPPLPIVARQSSSSAAPAVSLPARADTAASGEVMIGYRIQILQTENAREARDAQKEAIFRLDADAYLSYNSPYYKVRIGDFATRHEAEDFMRIVMTRGYPGAWIVRTRINADKAKNIPDNF